MKLKETEGTPIVQSEEYWMKEFRKQRADRLQDSVDEYMQDGEVGRFFTDLRGAIQSLIDYHSGQKKIAEDLMKVVSGHRPLQQSTDEEYLRHKYNLAEADYYDKRAQLDLQQQLPERY